MTALNFSRSPQPRYVSADVVEQSKRLETGSTVCKHFICMHLNVSLRMDICVFCRCSCLSSDPMIVVARQYPMRPGLLSLLGKGVRLDRRPGRCISKWLPAATVLNRDSKFERNSDSLEHGNRAQEMIAVCTLPSSRILTKSQHSRHSYNHELYPSKCTPRNVPQPFARFCSMNGTMCESKVLVQHALDNMRIVVHSKIYTRRRYRRYDLEKTAHFRNMLIFAYATTVPWQC